MILLKTPRVSSALKAVDLLQNPAPLIIGERLNAQGSKKAKECVLNDNFEELVKLARDQVEDGAHCLDVCVATTERSDELEFMKKLVKLLSLEIDAPLVIDSTEPKVIAAALEQIPGKPIINSINLEGDGSRFHLLAPLMVKYGVPAVAMCIGPKGMAKTPKEKLETAELLVETGKKYGLTEEHFIFDVLTFTLATGSRISRCWKKYTRGNTSCQRKISKFIYNSWTEQCKFWSCTARKKDSQCNIFVSCSKIWA